MEHQILLSKALLQLVGLGLHGQRGGNIFDSH